MRAVAGALDDASIMNGDCRIDQVAAQGPEPCQRAILVRSGEPAVADDIGDQDRRKFPGLAHRAPSAAGEISTEAPLMRSDPVQSPAQERALSLS